MSLLHTLIARESTILAELGSSSYSAATQTILSKIPPNDSKLTYAADDLLIHYIKNNGLVFSKSDTLCAAIHHRWILSRWSKACSLGSSK